jgi:hypothetical protein
MVRNPPAAQLVPLIPTTAADPKNYLQEERAAGNTHTVVAGRLALETAAPADVAASVASEVEAETA